MAVDGDDAVGVFIDDDAAGVHAERADVVFKLFRAVDDLALVQLVGQVREHDGRQLDAHTQIDAVGLGLHAQLVTHRLHPLAAAAADGDDALFAGELPIRRSDGVAAVDDGHMLNRRIKEKCDLFLQLGVQVFQHDEIDVRAQMAHRRVEQVELILDAELFELRTGGGIELGALAAMGHVNFVDVAHELQRLLLADMLVERAAEVVGDVILAVGKRARAAEAAHNRAALAADAALDLLAVDWAAALFQRVTGLKDRDVQFRRAVRQLVGGKNPAGPRADDNNVIMHSVSPSACAAGLQSCYSSSSSVSLKLSRKCAMK